MDVTMIVLYLAIQRPGQGCSDMTDCRAVQIALIFGLSIFVGCASLRKNDVDSAYNLPGDLEPDRGIFTETTDNLVSGFRSAIGLGPSEAAAKEAFELAMASYEEAKQLEGRARRDAFEDVGKMFSKAAVRWPNSSIEEDAMFYRAESAFFADRYPQAQSIFSNLVSKYPSTRYIDKLSQRRFEIAKYWLDHHEQIKQLPITPNFVARDRPTFDRFGNAIKLLERIRLDDPTGDLADDATMLAATSCFEQGKYYRADELLTDLRRSFPNSTHQYNAHLIGLKTKIQLYQGPNYAPGPLDSAEELVKQMRRQFPGESGKNDEFLQAAYKDIRMNRAVREITQARYRDQRQEYRAARVLYERVAREFGDTSLSKDAEVRLAQLEGLPDLPPQRLQVLANAFPTSSDDQPLIATPGTPTRR